MNLSPFEMIRILLFVAIFLVMLACAAVWLFQNFNKPKQDPVPLPANQVPASVRNAAPPAPRYQDTVAAEVIPQTSTRALQVFQEFGATLVSLGVPQEEVTKTLDPYAPLLLKPKASK